MVYRSLGGVLVVVCVSACSDDTAIVPAHNAAGDSGASGMSGMSGMSNSGAGGSSNPGAGATNAGTSATSAGTSNVGGQGGLAGQAGQTGGGAGTSGSAATAGNGGTNGGGGASGSGGDASTPTLPKRMLLYHFSTFTIDSVPAQLTLLKSQLQSWGYEVEDSVNPDDLSMTNLARFGGVGMINTCFQPFGAGKTGDAQTAALKAFVDNGGGLFGTHCAAVTFQSAEPPHAYNDLIGGRGGHGVFDGKSTCRATAAHTTTTMLPATFDFNGNLDNADYLAPDSTVLVKCKWSGGNMTDTAVSWLRTPGKGRVFYTDFAKVDGDLSDATLGQNHILLGLGWVLGR